MLSDRVSELGTEMRNQHDTVNAPLWKVKLLVVNQDATPAEFESKPLGREKLVAGKSTITVNLGPLKPGRYPFVEEYHETEPGAQGTIIVE